MFCTFLQFLQPSLDYCEEAAKALSNTDWISN